MTTNILYMYVCDDRIQVWVNLFDMKQTITQTIILPCRNNSFSKKKTPIYLNAKEYIYIFIVYNYGVYGSRIYVEAIILKGEYF